MEYFVLDLNSFSHHKWAPAEVNWWSGLVGIHGEYVFVSNYPGQDNPGSVSLGIYERGEQLDEIENFQFHHVQEQFVVGVGEDLKTYAYDLSQKQLKAYEISDEIVHQDKMVFPSLYMADDPSFDTIREFMSTMGVVVSLAAEYLETKDHVIFSYYKGKEIYSRFIIVVKEGEVVLHVQMDQDMKGVSTESFLTYQNLLIFAENRQTLQVYEL